MRHFTIERFGLRDMVECGSELRELALRTSCAADLARGIVDFFFERLRDGRGERAVVLARLFTTEVLERLDPALQALARSVLAADLCTSSVRCLQLLGTRGEKPEWNDVRRSRDHRVIPLRDASIVEKAPMLSRLASQFGLRPEDLVAPDPERIRELVHQRFNVFYVPDACGSPFVPAQESFVVPLGIRTVLGFGGSLPDGAIFAVLLFLRQVVSDEVAQMFQPLALSVKVALLEMAQRSLVAARASERCAAGEELHVG